MYLERYCNETGIKKSTIKGYKTAVKRYTEYYQKTLDELIDEAIAEEDDGVPLKRRSIKTRLLQFRTYLLQEGKLEISTIKSCVSKLMTLYSYFEVEVPKLPTIKDNSPEITYLDLPNKKHINEAVKLSGIRMASLILFMASSGTGRAECAELTIGDFLKACEGYYTETELYDILEELSTSIEPIVPTFSLVRIKTQKSYFTFCTPEAVNAMIDWLLLKKELFEADDKELSVEDTVWGWSDRQISYQFAAINDELQYGFKKKYRFFRPHTLRKFHASNIGLSDENVDFLQGRSKNKLHATYIKANPEKLKGVYMDVMDNVTIGNLDKKEIIHEEFTININLMIYGQDFGITL